MAPAAGYQQAAAEVELEDFEDVTLLAAPMDVEKAQQQQHESMGSRLWRWLPAWLGNGRTTHGFEQLRSSETEGADAKPGKQQSCAGCRVALACLQAPEMALSGCIASWACTQSQLKAE